MPVTYPPPPPATDGETVEVHRFMSAPTLVQRRLRDISENRFISDVLLPGRYNAANGSIAFEQGGESQYTERDVEIVEPGMEYPRSAVGMGPQQIVSVKKWGQDVPVTDEAIANMNIAPVDRALRKVSNQMVKKVDGISLAAIVSTVTQSIDASTSWLGAGAVILRDILRAVAKVRTLNEGFELDTIVVDDELWAYIASDPTLATIMARETTDNVVYTGEFPKVAGLTLLPTPNLPFSDDVLVLDSEQLGGMAEQDLGGPGYSGALRGIQSKVIRDDENDQYLTRGRRVTVPVVNEPLAAIRIRGARD